MQETKQGGKLEDAMTEEELGGDGAQKPEASSEDDIPDWAVPWLPPSLKIPAGRSVGFARFKSKWTDAQEVGVPSVWRRAIPGSDQEQVTECLSRVVIYWNLSDAEERAALKRCAGDRSNVVAEYTKNMIRAVDGKVFDWTGNSWAKGNGKPNAERVSPHAVWTQLGSKCRQMMTRIYMTSHSLNDEDMGDFLLHGVRLVTAVGG